MILYHGEPHRTSYLVGIQVFKFARHHWGNGLYGVVFRLVHTNHLHGKRGPYILQVITTPKKRKFACNLWGNRVLCGNFSIITHKSPSWKTGTTKFEWITTKKFWNLHETTKAVGFMRSHFHYYTQITLYNGMIYYGLRIILDAYPKYVLLELARKHLTQAAAVKTPQFLKNRG